MSNSEYDNEATHECLAYILKQHTQTKYIYWDLFQHEYVSM